MTALTEPEILACLRENFRLAAEDCDRLFRGERGPVYRRFRDEMRLIEGACRQMCHWREDARWLRIGLDVAEAQKRVRKWIVRRAPIENFRKLALILQGYAFHAAKLEHERTSRLGPILPRPLEGPLRQGRPVQAMLPGERVSSGGIILPQGATIH